MIYSISLGLDGFWFLSMGGTDVLSMHDDQVPGETLDKKMDYMIQVWTNMD